MNLVNCMGSMYKLELSFSDFYTYLCISEIHYPKKKHNKISAKSSTFVSSINF